MSGDERGPDVLREAWLGSSRDAAPRADCPEPSVLWEAARGETDPGTARALVSHTVECPACAEAWRLAMEVARMEPAEAPRLAAAAPSRTEWRWIGVAATVAALAAAGALLVRHGPETDRPLFRDTERLAIRSLLPETAPVPRASCLLRWSGGPPGTRYRIEVATERLDVVDRARDLDRPEYLVPAKALAAVPPGARLLWQVEARTPDGGRVTSPTFVLRLD
jgi:hypothetical protein